VHEEGTQTSILIKIATQTQINTISAEVEAEAEKNIKNEKLPSNKTER